MAAEQRDATVAAVAAAGGGSAAVVAAARQSEAALAMASEVERLQAKLEGKKAALGAWCDEQREQVRAARGSALERLEAMGKRLASLKEEAAELESASYTNDIRLRAERKKMDAIEGKLAELRQEEHDVENDMADANAARVSVLEQIKGAEQAIEQEREEQDLNVKMLTQGARMYKKLGLDFERVGDSHLRVRFTQIDRARPDRAFFFHLFVDKDDKYHVEQVEPPVGSIAQLLMRFNQTNDLSWFVRTMRQRFQALCANNNP